MKSLVIIFTFIMFCEEAFPLGDTSILPNGEPMAETVSNLNQLTKEEALKQEVAPLSPQDEEELRHQADLEREKKEFEKQKQIEESRFD